MTQAHEVAKKESQSGR